MRTILGAALLFGAALLAGCRTNPVASQPMSVGAPTLPPRGFVEFCRRHAEDCAPAARDAERAGVLDADRWRELAKVNDAVNRGFDHRPDGDTRGVSEHWSYITGTSGDCEDFALEKRRRLIAAGWPPDALLVAVADIPRVGGHAVLVVVTDRGDYVLDVIDREIRPWEEVRYRWLKRQSRANPMVWVELRS